MEHPPNMKSNSRGKRSTESVGSVSSVGSGVATSRYNLRSHGPPNYEQFADQECPICLEEYLFPVIVNCGHSFCRACIKKCIASGSFTTCPVCKKYLVQQLFISSVDFTKRIQKKSQSQTRNSILSPNVLSDASKRSKSKKPAQDVRRTII